MTDLLTVSTIATLVFTQFLELEASELDHGFIEGRLKPGVGFSCFPPPDG